MPDLSHKQVPKGVIGSIPTSATNLNQYKMKHRVLLTVFGEDGDVDSYVSCREFDKIGAEKFREEILRQISNVLAGEKNNVVVNMTHDCDDEEDVALSIPEGVVKTCPISVAIIKDYDEEYFEPDEPETSDHIPLPN